MENRAIDTFSLSWGKSYVFCSYKSGQICWDTESKLVGDKQKKNIQWLSNLSEKRFFFPPSL